MRVPKAGSAYRTNQHLDRRSGSTPGPGVAPIYIDIDLYQQELAICRCHTPECPCLNLHARKETQRKIPRQPYLILAR